MDVMMTYSFLCRARSESVSFVVVVVVVVVFRRRRVRALHERRHVQREHGDVVDVLEELALLDPKRAVVLKHRLYRLSYLRVLLPPRSVVDPHSSRELVSSVGVPKEQHVHAAPRDVLLDPYERVRVYVDEAVRARRRGVTVPRREAAHRRVDATVLGFRLHHGFAVRAWPRFPVTTYPLPFFHAVAALFPGAVPTANEVLEGQVIRVGASGENLQYMAGFPAAPDAVPPAAVHHERFLEVARPQLGAVGYRQPELFPFVDVHGEAFVHDDVHFPRDGRALEIVKRYRVLVRGVRARHLVRAFRLSKQLLDRAGPLRERGERGDHVAVADPPPLVEIVRADRVPQAEGRDVREALDAPGGDASRLDRFAIMRHFHSRTVNAPLRSFSLSNWSVAVTSDGRRNTVHLCFSQSSWSMSVWYNIAAHTFGLDLKLAMAFRIVPRPPRRSTFSGAMPEHVYRPPTPLDASSTHGEPPRALAAGAGDGLTGATPLEGQQPIARARAI
eukprot:31268-Pelagococcus_subviridis.AAC.8